MYHTRDLYITLNAQVGIIPSRLLRFYRVFFPDIFFCSRTFSHVFSLLSICSNVSVVVSQLVWLYSLAFPTADSHGPPKLRKRARPWREIKRQIDKQTERKKEIEKSEVQIKETETKRGGRRGKYQFIDLGQVPLEQDKQDIQQVNRAYQRNHRKSGRSKTNMKVTGEVKRPELECITRKSDRGKKRKKGKIKQRVDAFRKQALNLL